MPTLPAPAARAAGSGWEPTEVAAVVADYFAMMADEFAGRPYNKREHNRVLHALTGRSAGSIEFKHQNISAVLSELGLLWLRGYKPRANYQEAMVAEVGKHLPSVIWLQAVPADRPAPEIAVGDLFVPPPERNRKRASAPLERLVRKFDPAERDERNRSLGKAGEEFVVEVEERRLLSAGRRDLMSKVRWIARDEGDGAGFDIQSFEDDGRETLIEVKTTRGASGGRPGKHLHPWKFDRPGERDPLQVYKHRRSTLPLAGRQCLLAASITILGASAKNSRVNPLSSLP